LGPQTWAKKTADDMDDGNLSVIRIIRGFVFYFFNPYCQFNTTLIGLGVRSSRHVD